VGIDHGGQTQHHKVEHTPKWAIRVTGAPSGTLSVGIMTNRSRPTQAKRAREKALQEKRQQKAARRQDAKERQGGRSDRGDGVDPDIAGIVPGPQPHPFLDEDELDETNNT
jgi:hypothetical protein